MSKKPTKEEMFKWLEEIKEDVGWKMRGKVGKVIHHLIENQPEVDIEWVKSLINFCVGVDAEICSIKDICDILTDAGIKIKEISGE